MLNGTLLITLAIGTFMVLATCMIYYEIMRLSWNRLPHLRMKPRKRILLVAVVIFSGHTICVWLYGFAYWLLAEVFHFGGLQGEISFHFSDYLYFSAATYSSLGLGDLFPYGPLRLISGIEVLNGLVLIGWSVSFTYLAMQKFWDLHFPGTGEK